MEVVVAPAAETLRRLAEEGAEPFDLVFVDADKPSNPVYLDLALRLSHPGTLVVVDNTVRGGAVADTASEDPDVVGVRRLVDAVVADPRLEATAVQTVGEKGYDGFVLAERDLALRGPGDFFGTRQSGLPTLRVGDLLRDHALMEEARRDAVAWLDTGGSAQPLVDYLTANWATRFGLVGVG